MDANPSKSRRGATPSKRVRGVILSPQGWQKFQTAKQQMESDTTEKGAVSDTLRKRIVPEDLVQPYIKDLDEKLLSLEDD